MNAKYVSGRQRIGFYTAQLAGFYLPKDTKISLIR